MWLPRQHHTLTLTLTCAFVAAGCSSDPSAPSEPAVEGAVVSVPADFPALPQPDDNQLTVARAALGRALFYDKRLSRDETIACASCHVQAHAFADPAPLSLGVDGQLGTRNAPGLFNLAWVTSFFWDGGVPSLELQAVAPIRNPLEMDTTLAAVSERLAADADLFAAFEAAYGEGPSQSSVPRALAAFVRTLVSGDSRWDRFRRGDTRALSAAEQRGHELFNGERAECFHCHVGFNLTTNAFRNNGVAPDDPDAGRQLISSRSIDAGRFRVPSLRNVAVTAPYMHDGSLATLEEVVEHYAAGGRGHPNTDPLILPLDLSAREKADLVAFLRALTDEAFLTDTRFAAPAAPAGEAPVP